MVVAIGIASLVLLALAVTTLIGLRNSQYAQNQIQAAKLAQEGLEQTRSFRDRNIPICNSGTEYNWKSNSFWLSSFPNSSLTKFYFAQDPIHSACSITDNLNAANSNGELSLQGKFQRIVFISDNGDQVTKQFIVQVTWDDYSGKHDSKLVTILANY